MGRITLDDIKISRLMRIPTPGGDVLHAMKHNDQGYAGFGEVYFSFVTEGAVKGWKRHKLMTMNVMVPIGQVRFVFRLDGDKMFRVENIGVDRYIRLTVPPGIWFAFKGMGQTESLVVNIASITHDIDEVERLELSKIKYNWN